MQNATSSNSDHTFTGNICIFHAFDVGDDINLEKITSSAAIETISLPHSTYFKNYHRPISIDLKSTTLSSHCVSCKIYNFGVISFMYKIPFTGTLEAMRSHINDYESRFYDQSFQDVTLIFNRIKEYISKAVFCQTRSTYSVFQIDPQPSVMSVQYVKENYGGIIASALRFESEILAEYQKDEMLESAFGYFKGDLIIVDHYATFLYDAEYAELLDFFEFANIQQLELRYFDLVLDRQLNLIYEGHIDKIPLRAYFPYSGIFSQDQVGLMNKLKVDISVISERLEGAIKLAGEPYYSELYSILLHKLDIKNWHKAIDRKLEIIKDIQVIYQHKRDVIRENILTILIIILIFIELIVGILSYFKQ